MTNDKKPRGRPPKPVTKAKSLPSGRPPGRVAGYEQENIDTLFAWAFEQLAEKQLTLVKNREGEYVVRQFDGRISQTYPTALAAGWAAVYSELPPELQACSVCICVCSEP